MTKTFTTIDASGTVIFTSRGKVGAAQKAIDALSEYRASVKAASGNAHGLPHTLGHIAVDGVRASDCGCDGMYLAEDVAA